MADKKRLEPRVEAALDKFKTEIAVELGITDGKPGSTLEAALERYKAEIARELGIASAIAQEGWGNIKSRQCGMVGGRIGGKIGGRMVKKMIAMAEKELKS